MEKPRAGAGPVTIKTKIVYAMHRLAARTGGSIAARFGNLKLARCGHLCSGGSIHG